jgi:hypothetical protein
MPSLHDAPRPHETTSANAALTALVRLLARQAAREFLAASSNMTAGTKDGVSDADAPTPTTTAIKQDPRDDG